MPTHFQGTPEEELALDSYIKLTALTIRLQRAYLCLVPCRISPSANSVCWRLCSIWVPGSKHFG